MDTTFVRLFSQVLLVAWCALAAAVVLMARGRTMHAAGHRWAVLGLASFAVWMFLSALTIKDTEMFPRSSVLWIFAAAEACTATGAWGWLLSYITRNFHIRVNPRSVSARRS